MRRGPLILTVFVLAGCAHGAVTSTSSTTTAPPTVGNVAGVTDLQKVYATAGGTCAGNLTDTNKVTAASSSGTCPGSGTVLSTYVSHDDAARSVQITQSVSDRVGSTLILGDNWVVNPAGDDKDRVDAIAKAMGGQVIRRDPTPVTDLDNAMTLQDAAQAYAHAPGASCANPTPQQNGSVLRCDDGALVLDATNLPTTTVASRQRVADQIKAGMTVPGTPIVGRRHIIVVPSTVDVRTVADAVHGTPPSGT